MKIISKFKDYYDNAHGWYSPEPTYIRENKEFYYPKLDNNIKKKLAISGLFDAMPVCDIGNRYLIAFCGKVYPVYVGAELIFNSPDDLEKQLKKVLNGKTLTSVFDEKAFAKKHIQELYGKGVPRYWRSSYLTHKSWKRFEALNFTVAPEAFIELNAPVFAVWERGGSCYLTVNPMLNKLNFASHVDPYTAYQEIEMFVGNELVLQMDPNINRPDELVRDSKGFDEWSFKRHKEESKKRKKNK